ncbi:uncharacterized protein LOC114298945 [Camellia sinensis]|uniref:uncharacterized protein LOC114298945 n=1 Tax=Camellia sinensis TaxID=4442 RepID=UPI0010361E3D|nr:uncharacterized protein LOC114298945 [Camellia sinensis]
MSVVMEDGTKSTKITDIHDTFVQFYTKLFDTPISGEYNGLERIKSLVNKKGRRISDNIFLSQEIMRGYHRSSKTPKCAMKVDIMKAYDTVRWEFIIDILTAMNFPPCMINWINACMTSPSFSICINGSLHGGDPGTVSLIMQGLEEFRKLSGLTPNPNKSNIFFSGCSSELKANILQIAKFTEGSLPVKYLGVPLITTKLRASDCQTLVDRMTKRIKSWTNKLLSYVGRAQLIQSILFSMQGKSFWGIKVPSDPSWVWRKLLSLRDLIFPLIKFKLGNGGNVFLWYDNWHPFGSLLLRYGPRILYDTNLPDSSKEWIAATPHSLKPSLDSPDIPVWSLTADGSFSIHSAWECWRDKGPKVTWSNLIWGPPVIPRVSLLFGLLSKLNVIPIGLLCPGWNLLSLLLNPSIVNL